MLTSAQIVSLACQIAKCPGYTTQAGQLLNTVLVSMAVDQNLDIIRRTATINVLPGQASYALPTNFLRMREVFYNVNGVPFYLILIDISEYDALFSGPNTTTYPEYCAIDQATNLIYFYPLPLSILTITIRYMDTVVEITSPETSSVIPWFIKQDTLITKLSEQLMRITDDTRQADFKALGDASFDGFLKLTNGTTLKTVSLDPRKFRKNVNNLHPTKLYP